MVVTRAEASDEQDDFRQGYTGGGGAVNWGQRGDALGILGLLGAASRSDVGMGGCGRRRDGDYRSVIEFGRLGRFLGCPGSGGGAFILFQ